MSPAAIRPLRIFLVEDHPDTVEVLTALLQMKGYTVASASSMNAALAALPEAGCDVLVSDIGLPDGDGCELLQRLRRSGKVFPRYAIAVSGYGTDADRSRSAAAGFNHHLLKPYNMKDLLKLLEDAACRLDADAG